MSDIQVDQRVDARGKSCPLPIVLTAQAMKTLQTGQLVEVLATDPGSVKDFESWAAVTGNAMVESDTTGGVFRFVLRHK
jgi:tRNA 2-thiouridine synthesizing protein A